MRVGGEHLTCYLGLYNGSAACVPEMSIFGTDANVVLSQAAAPAGALAFDGVAGMNAAALWTAVISAVQMLRRWRRR
jgi:hypothetical protein